ncbi:MAG TPA: PHP domain-containing protein [Bacilli bacterium]|nr:PHP domain-containing protein [Bacilli bacterium]
MTKANYHTHTYLCGHAEGLPIDYVQKAIELGLEHIGISDHGYLKDKWVDRMNLEEYHNIYLPSIQEAKEKYGDKIEIFTGLELEYLDGYDSLYQKYYRENDYLILGQHIVEVDGIEYDLYKPMNDSLIIAYKEAVIKGMESGYFKILAHPDLYMLRYREWNDLTEKIAIEIIESAIKNDVYLEINGNGTRRAATFTKDLELTWLYPRVEFWRIVSRYQEAKVIVGDDAHYFAHLHDLAVTNAILFAKKMGITIYDKIL